MRTWMAWAGAAALALAGAGAAAPVARAGDAFRIEFRRPGVSVVVGRRAPERRWIPAHVETRTRTVVVREGFWTCETRPAVVSLRFDPCTRSFVRVVVRPAETVRAWVPPVVEVRTERVLVPGRRAADGD